MSPQKRLEELFQELNKMATEKQGLIKLINPSWNDIPLDELMQIPVRERLPNPIGAQYIFSAPTPYDGSKSFSGDKIKSVANYFNFLDKLGMNPEETAYFTDPFNVPKIIHYCGRSEGKLIELNPRELNEKYYLYTEQAVRDMNDSRNNINLPSPNLLTEKFLEANQTSMNDLKRETRPIILNMGSIPTYRENLKNKKGWAEARAPIMAQYFDIGGDDKGNLVIDYYMNPLQPVPEMFKKTRKGWKGQLKEIHPDEFKVLYPLPAPDWGESAGKSLHKAVFGF